MARPPRSASKLDRAFHVLRTAEGAPFTRHVDPEQGPFLVGMTPEGVPITMTETDDGLALSAAYVFTPEALETPDRCALFAHACTLEASVARFMHRGEILLAVSHYAGGVNADDLLFWVETFEDEAFIPEDLDLDHSPPLLQDAPAPDEAAEAPGASA